MFVGHYAPAYALKARYREAPLWALMLAVQAVDIAFYCLVPLGIERLEIFEGRRGPLAVDLVHMPLTHSLLSAVVLCGVCVAAGGALKRPRVGIAVGLAVASHWLLDLLVHRPDLPLTWWGTQKLGLGLWHYPLVSFVLEMALLGAAFVWLRAALPAGTARRWATGGFVVLVLAQVAQDFLLPPPTSKLALSISGEISYLIVAALALPVDRALRLAGAHE